MPFGLCNVAQTFQCFVDEIIWGFPFVHAYIDDLLIDRETIKEHEQHLQLVFTRLSQFGIIINPAKCPFGVPTVCWEFMGIVNFHRFIPNCADTIHPQNGLLTRHGKEPKRLLVWSNKCASAFTAVKSSLAEATMLVHPKSDAPLCIMVDVSDVAIGGVFQQRVEGKWEPISFFSKRFQPTETRYSIFTREWFTSQCAIFIMSLRV